MLHHMRRPARVSLVLDAVDECEVSSREILLRNLASLNQKGSILKVFVTSRPNEQASEIRSQYRHFEITTPDTAADMEALIVTRVGSFATCRHLSDEIERRIIDFLLANARGMFLWVVLVMEELERRDERLTDEVIAVKLSRISVTLVNTYKAMLENVSESRKENFWRIVRWLLYGRRALSIAELETALSLELSIERWHDFGGDVKFLCGSLISIDSPEDTMNLVHQTAREFLETHLSTATRDETGEVDMDSIKSEVRLAKTCVQYLLQTSYAELTIIATSTFIISEYFEQMNVFVQDKPFLRYAIENWASHLQAVGKPGEVLWSSVLQLFSSQERCDSIISLTYHFINRGNPCAPRRAPTLHLAGYFNLPSLVEEYIRQGANVNAIVDMGGTPLLWASEKGSSECVKMLLDAGADPNKAEWDGWTPLHWAARAGNLEVANLLLNAGANIHARDSKGATPVEWAIVRSHWDVVNSIDLKLQSEEFHKVQTIMRTQYGLHENQAIIQSSSNIDEE